MHRINGRIMELDNLKQRLADLPKHAQREVAELIAALEARHVHSHATGATPLCDEPFIGCWKDRDDLSDSTAWVRHARRREWRAPDA